MDGTGVAFGERTLPAAETVEVAVSVVEVGEPTASWVDPLILLAFDTARGFATLGEGRVDVDRENGVRAEGFRKFRGWRSLHDGRSTAGIWRCAGRCHERRPALE